MLEKPPSPIIETDAAKGAARPQQEQAQATRFDELLRASARDPLVRAYVALLLEAQGMSAEQSAAIWGSFLAAGGEPGTKGPMPAGR
jgi:hypothetical protein